ncbi:hypothetical protein ACLOJK_040619 [Asimina triloba]
MGLGRLLRAVSAVLGPARPCGHDGRRGFALQVLLVCRCCCRRFNDRMLLVTDVMEGTDWPMECPPSMGLSATYEMVVAAVGVVEPSPSMAGSSRI